jgi:HlyD family secretion protein
VIGVPISAIVIRNDTTSTPGKKPADAASDKKFETVFVKDGNLAKLRVVTTGIQDNRNIEIVSGLKEGETVITGPYNTVTKSLKDGDEVSVGTNKTPPSE